MVAAELPQEILIDIFSRLPEKTVGQCRCLSQPWRNILSSPHFIKSHLNRKTHQQNCILMTDSLSMSTKSIATTKDGGVSTKLELPFVCTEILASCDGLVLSENEEGDQFLLNPVTLKHESIPNSPLALVDGGREIITLHGFGYDSSIDDYKIVTLSYYNSSDNEYERDCEETFVDVYYVKRGVWKRVENCSPYNHAFHDPCSGAFSNGAIHWLARTRESSHRSVLIAFDLSAEAFTEIPVPDDIKMEAILLGQVVVLGGCLSVIDVEGFYSRMNVWMMKEYGLVESWTKLCIHTGGQYLGLRKPLCFVGDQEIGWVVDGPSLGVYNLKEGTLRDMIVDGVPIVDLDDAITFVPSLVSPASVDEAYYASLSADALEEAYAANLGRLLSNHSILEQGLADNMMAISSAIEEKSVVNKRQLQCALRKRISELSALSRDHNKLQAVVRRLLEMGRQCVEACEALAKCRVDLYENLAAMYRVLLRALGEVGENIRC